MLRVLAQWPGITRRPGISWRGISWAEYPVISGQTGISAVAESNMVCKVMHYIASNLKDSAEAYVNLLPPGICSYFSTKSFNFLAISGIITYKEPQSFPLRQMQDSTVLAMYDAVDGFKRWGEDI